MLLLVVLLLVPGVVALLASRPFEPHPSLAPLRGLVTGMALAAGGMLLSSLGHDWWVIEDWEREATLITRADSFLVQAIVVTGLLSSLLTVTAAWGRRNGAPLGLTVAWLLLGIGWFAATGELVDSDASGEVESGLRLATWSMLLVTISAVLGSFGRLAERRSRGLPPAGYQADRVAGTPAAIDIGPPSPPRPTATMTGWDVAAATVIAVGAVAVLLGGGHPWTWPAFLVAALLTAGIYGVKAR